MEVREVIQDVRLQEWANNIRDQKASGLSIVAWCKENNMNAGSYYYWLNKLRKVAIEQFPEGRQEKTTFVPMQVPSAVSNVSHSKANSDITIRKGNISIEFYNDTPLSTITSILEFLQC